MFGIGETKLAKGKFYGANKYIYIWDDNVDNTD